MSDVTQILNAIEHGDPKAAEELLPLVYDELRKLAAQKLVQEKPGQTLDATALVHEAYLRLVDGADTKQWNGRGHFFTAAAEAMRRILIEKARRKQRWRHGGGLKKVDLLLEEVAGRPGDDEILLLDEALDKLVAVRPQAAALVKLRFFSGFDGRRGCPGRRAAAADRTPFVELCSRVAAAGDGAVGRRGTVMTWPDTRLI
jgi:RNA polymerase sigma factor (TIGR02999 family)